MTDANGRAEVELRLPDKLTTWRLDARAWTEGRAGDLLVGEATRDLLSSKPLLIRPVTPRFLVVGDRAELSAVVHNNTDRDVSLSVSLENTGGLALAAGESFAHSMSLPPGGRGEVAWLVDVGDVHSVAPVFVARSDDGAFSDASVSPVSGNLDGTLPVQRFVSSETVGTLGMLRGAESRSEALLMPRGLDSLNGSLDVRLDKSLAGLTAQSLSTLEADTERYPECASAIISRFLPNVVSYRAMRQLGLTDTAQRSKLDALVSAGMRQLYARQLPGGGWSWCGAPRADVMASAYVLIGLAQAAHDYPVESAVIERAQRYLRRQLIRPSLEFAPWQLNRQAFLLFALAQAGAPDIARNATLFESRDRLSLDAIAFLAQTLYQVNPDDHARLLLLSQMLHNRAVVRATGAFFEEPTQDRRNWSSNLRTTALALDTLLKLEPGSELLPNIVRYLVSARGGRNHWSSPQEDTWVIIALTNWMLTSGDTQPAYRYGVTLNGDTLLADVARPDDALDGVDLSIAASELIPRETNLLEIERDAGAGALYYSARLKLDLPVDQIEPLSRGIEISRRYNRLGADPGAAVSAAQIGDRLRARLQIVVPNTLRHVVIKDFLPAGAEAINPELTTSSQLGTMPGGARVSAEQTGWGWWFFDRVEFRDEKVVIYASHLPPGVYEYVYALSPVIAGEFQVMPPVARELYFPEVYGRGAGMRFVIDG